MQTVTIGKVDTDPTLVKITTATTSERFTQLDQLISMRDQHQAQIDVLNVQIDQAKALGVKTLAESKVVTP